ncbi:MAG: DUF2029 domain-containing protein, partial [Oricola sp.]|nr:DUF2029 domain-containing protein [Oricola sp.]
TLHNGQTSALMFFGLALCAYGFVREKPLLITVAIVILMLKPQVGVPVSAFIFLSKNGARPVLIAAAIVIASGAQAFLIAGFSDTITLFLERMAAYESNDPMANSSIRMTGVRNIIHLFSSAETPMMAYVAVAALIASAAALFLRAREGFSGGGATLDRLVAFCCLTTVLVFLLPLHSNDLIMLVAAAPLLFLVPWGPGLVIAAGLALMFRSNNLAPLLERIDLNATSGYFAAMAFVETIALTLCIAGLAAVVWSGTSRRLAS